MQIYPAIDLKNGQCVRLYQGDFAAAKTYSDDPLAVAEDFIKQGATWLHLVDLDAAKNPVDSQYKLIEKILKTFDIEIQIGGGIREKEQIKNLLELGASRVIIGSQAVYQPESVKSWLNFFGKEKIVLALDVTLVDEIPYMATHGWQTKSETKLFDLLDFYQKNISHLLCTDISRDGTMLGPNISLYLDILKVFPELFLQASGGVSNLSDIQMLKENNMPGVVVGRALYEKKFSLNEALTC